jgi:hypothetical protein
MPRCCKRYGTLGFHKIWTIWPSERMSASQNTFCSVGLVTEQSKGKGAPVLNPLSTTPCRTHEGMEIRGTCPPAKLCHYMEFRCHLHVPNLFTPRRITGLKTRSGAMEREKSLAPGGNRIPNARQCKPQHVAIQTKLSQLLSIIGLPQN